MQTNKQDRVTIDIDQVLWVSMSGTSPSLSFALEGGVGMSLLYKPIWTSDNLDTTKPSFLLPSLLLSRTQNLLFPLAWNLFQDI